MREKQQWKQKRIPYYEYSYPGAYFITICTNKKQKLFELFPILKKITEEEWFKLQVMFSGIELDQFVIMPNHLHFIIFILDPANAAAQTGKDQNIILGDVIRAFKSNVAKRFYEYVEQEKIKFKEKIWQFNYFEHAIRDDRDLRIKREYIKSNPDRWKEDAYYVS